MSAVRFHALHAHTYTRTAQQYTHTGGTEVPPWRTGGPRKINKVEEVASQVRRCLQSECARLPLEDRRARLEGTRKNPNGENSLAARCCGRLGFPRRRSRDDVEAKHGGHYRPRTRASRPSAGPRTPREPHRALPRASHDQPNTMPLKNTHKKHNERISL